MQENVLAAVHTLRRARIAIVEVIPFDRQRTSCLAGSWLPRRPLGGAVAWAAASVRFAPRRSRRSSVRSLMPLVQPAAPLPLIAVGTDDASAGPETGVLASSNQQPVSQQRCSVVEIGFGVCSGSGQSGSSSKR